MSEHVHRCKCCDPELAMLMQPDQPGILNRNDCNGNRYPMPRLDGVSQTFAFAARPGPEGFVIRASSRPALAPEPWGHNCSCNGAEACVEIARGLVEVEGY